MRKVKVCGGGGHRGALEEVVDLHHNFYQNNNRHIVAVAFGYSTTNLEKLFDIFSRFSRS